MEKQFDLFDNEIKEDWEKEWQDMPEFVQEDKGPFRQIIISFENQEDVNDFATLIDQNISNKTRSLWYPKAEIETLMDKRWVEFEEIVK